MNVYVMTCKAGQIKVGVSDQIEERLKQIQRKMDTQMTIAHTWSFNNTRDPWVLEQSIIDALSDYSLGGEWFRCIPEYAVVAGQDYLADRLRPSCQTNRD